MTKKERKKAENFLHEIWTRDAHNPDYTREIKEKFMLIQEAIWSNPADDSEDKK